MLPSYESPLRFQEGWSSLQTHSRTPRNPPRGLTLQMGMLGNLKARTALRMCSKNLQLAPNCGTWVKVNLIPGDLLSLTNADAAEVQEDHERVETNRQYFEQRAKFLVVDESLPSGVLFLHREVRDVLKFAVLLCEVEHATEKSESTIDRGPLRTLSEPLLNELLNRVGVDAADQHPPERLIEMLEAANAGFTVLLVTERLILLVAVLKKERSADVFVPEFLVELSVTVLRFAQTLAEQRFRN